MRKLDKVPIDWESTGYSVLKDLDASILGIFCEFIDNSIQSFRNDSELIKSFEPDFQLKIDLIKTDSEIIIKDNAGGIDIDNFERALKPANRPKNKEGLNEFGIGMKYAAVWISNKWVLKSKSFKENVQRTVTFDYQEVVSNNLKSLVPEEILLNDKSHGTEIILSKLEKERVARWPEKYLKTKLASIYRNFIRSGGAFYSQFTEIPIEIRYNGELLIFEEFGFLKAPWWKSLQIDQIEDSPEVEWKWKFPWRKIEIQDEELDFESGEIINIQREVEVTGFIGILPDGNHSGRNGFTLYRRGRMIEGVDNRVYPVSISTSSSRSFKHIRLYGEIHFRNVNVSFNKSRLTIDTETRNEIFSVLAMEISKIKINDFQYDMLQQADKHRAGFKISSAISAIQDRKRGIEERDHEPLIFEKNEELKEEISKTVIDEDYIEKNTVDINGENISIIDNEEIQDYKVGVEKYSLKITHLNSDSISQLYTLNIVEDFQEKTVNVGINLKHRVFTEDPDIFKEKELKRFNLIVEFIKCLAMSEVRCKNGINNAGSFRAAFNLYSKSINI